MAVAVIALGSNLESAFGDSSTTLEAAFARLAKVPGLESVTCSRIVISSPAGTVLNQPDFCNAIALVSTTLAPATLLLALQDLEAEFGRTRSGASYTPGGPRTLDLDLIDYEGIVCSTPELTLPHPRALERDFVVTPLLEVSPCHVLANGQAVTRRFIEGGWVQEAEAGQEGDVPFVRTAKQLLACNNFAPSRTKGTSPSCPAALSGPRLSIVATPIGNLADITLRALDTLRAANVIYCEDTRITRKLTRAYGLTAPLQRADSHKLPAVIPQILEELATGKRLAYVTDAGMPAISDPGSLLVAAVREAGYAVEVVPGASALTTALVASGLKGTRHYFGGFFPRKAGAARRLLEELAALEDTILVFYESNHRTQRTLAFIAEVLPGRELVMARELTKLHEEVLAAPAPELAAVIARRVQDGRALKGEVVLLIGAAQDTPVAQDAQGASGPPDPPDCTDAQE